MVEPESPGDTTEEPQIVGQPGKHCCRMYADA
jgi:hypothetical protein